MSDPFESAATGDFIDFTELEGCLLLITVHEYKDNIPTKFSKEGEDTPAIVADVVVLDSEEQTKYENAMIFPRQLVAQLRPRVGGMVLERLTKEPAPNRGKNSYKWVFPGEVSEDDKNLARKWIKENTKDPFSASA